MAAENQEKLINRESLSEYTGGADADEEFVEALVNSFNNFIHDYRLFMLSRDMERLRRSGHSIKPTAKMMDLDVLIDEYEQGKKLIRKQADQEEIRASCNRMQKIVDRVLAELKEFIN